MKSKCFRCRAVYDDKDAPDAPEATDVTMTTVRNSEGQFVRRGRLCAYHRDTYEAEGFEVETEEGA